MKTKIMSIFTRTPLHVGCGSSVGAVDQPVGRERHTGYPIIPGSTIKGVLADLWTVKNENGDYVREKELGVKLFGNDPVDKDAKAKAGSLLIGEGKLLAFPVRSAKGCWAWLTSPLVLNRFARDYNVSLGRIPDPGDEEAVAPARLTVESRVVFEEYPLKAVDSNLDTIVEQLKMLQSDAVWGDNLAEHLTVVSNDVFAYFAKNACEIANHNRIDDKTGVVADGALFSQENVPSETMFYSVLNSQEAEDLDKLEQKLGDEKNLLQIGADMTTGLGWCSVAMKEVR